MINTSSEEASKQVSISLLRGEKVYILNLKTVTLMQPSLLQLACRSDSPSWIAETN